MRPRSAVAILFCEEAHQPPAESDCPQRKSRGCYVAVYIENEVNFYLVFAVGVSMYKLSNKRKDKGN
ncbi:hypothetical protein CFK40_12660 [Virgibacillus necropolis]|uniref:Uncharacterized protein n=1 Tax=Virgibacillus necropolis TaxID=163877 RepID=A0A221MDX0_9BACI|nr:hypothetical protein CFK40_12660 [Virgibacillus necropolis]